MGWLHPTDLWQVLVVKWRSNALVSIRFAGSLRIWSKSEIGISMFDPITSRFCGLDCTKYHDLRPMRDLRSARTRGVLTMPWKRSFVWLCFCAKVYPHFHGCGASKVCKIVNFFFLLSKTWFFLGQKSEGQRRRWADWAQRLARSKFAASTLELGFTEGSGLRLTIFGWKTRRSWSSEVTWDPDFLNSHQFDPHFTLRRSLTWAWICEVKEFLRHMKATK